MTIFTQQEWLHYRRHFNLPEIGIDGQKRLKAARVLCVGAGGLGSPLLLYLAAAGIGTLGIVDDDVVDASNLQRQVLYTYDDIDCKKVIAAKARLQQINPAITVLTHDVRLTEENAATIFNDYDFIVDGSDNFATRYIVNDQCFFLKKTYVYASIAQFSGQCTVIAAPEGPCYRCLFPSPPSPHLIPNCSDGGVLGVLPGIMGSIQATEIVKLILHIGNPLIGRLLVVDGLSMQFREFIIPTNPQCRLCAHGERRNDIHSSTDMTDKNAEIIPSISVEELAELLTKSADFILLDVREEYEYQICHLGAKLIPLHLLTQQLPDLNKEKKIIVHCKQGHRSLQAITILKNHGFTNSWHLRGGILEWIKKIDPKMSSY